MGERVEGRRLRGVEGSYRRSRGYWGERMGVDGFAGSVLSCFSVSLLAENLRPESDLNFLFLSILSQPRLLAKG